MISLPDSVRQAIREHGRRSYPEECCGALLGRKGEGIDCVTEAEPVDNLQEGSRKRRFRITPRDYLRIERLALERERDLLGFYHSHPDNSSIPSDYDREHALPFFHYVVLGVALGIPREMASWVLSEDRGVFDREKIEVLP
jgi:proteasome lid subunit RPN8/RPN11